LLSTPTDFDLSELEQRESFTTAYVGIVGEDSTIPPWQHKHRTDAEASSDWMNGAICMPKASDELVIRQLSTGTAEPVLVVDFHQYSTAPRLSQMLSDLARGRSVYQVDPVEFLSRGRHYVSLPELAEVYATAFLSSEAAGGRAITVGYCSASALALRVGKLLAKTREVATILVRPSWPGDEHVWSRFADSLNEIGAAPRPFPSLDGDAGAAVARMEWVLRGELTLLARRSGLKGAAGECSELLVRYRGWLAFLLACRNDLRATWQHFTPMTRGVTVIVDDPEDASVPGLQPEACGVVRLPPGGEESGISAELAETVLAQFANP
jgi:hypothetical protein